VYNKYHSAILAHPV